MPAGSYGLPVRRSSTGAEFAMTAAHVVGSLSWAHDSGRTDVWLAVSSGVPGSGDPNVGRVHASHPPAPCDEVELDVSLVEPFEQVALKSTIRGECISGIPRDVEASAENDNPVVVYKRGILGQLTEGLLEPFATSVVLESLQPDGTRRARSYSRVFLVYGVGQPFAVPGDSGSAVIDGDDCVVGMLVGLRPHNGHVNEEAPGIVVPIIDILQTMGLELVGTAAAVHACLGRRDGPHVIRSDGPPGNTLRCDPHLGLGKPVCSGREATSWRSECRRTIAGPAVSTR